MLKARTLAGFVRGLRKAELVEDEVPFFQAGKKTDVDERVYRYFLKTLAGVTLNGTSFFAASPAGPYRLFWRRGGRCYGRELTADEVHRFNELCK